MDPGEKAFIRALGIKAYTMHEVDRHGIGKVLTNYYVVGVFVCGSV